MKYAKLLLVLMLVLAIGSVAFAQEDGPPPLPGEVFATGFNGPQGVLVDPDGNVWVIESGLGGEEDFLFIAPGNPEPIESTIGDSARIVAISPDGEQTEVTALPSINAGNVEVIGGARLALLDGSLYATNGQWIEGLEADRLPLLGAVVEITEDGNNEVANLWAHEEANNPDGLVVDSHPYGISAGPDGMLYVADAGANALLRVDPATGEVETVAAFEGLPGAFPNPARNMEVEADPVPTAVVVGEDGTAYVSLLSGAPFIPGSSKVVAVSPDGEVSDYAVGLTMLTDLRMGPDGEMYGVQFSLFTEQGPDISQGKILRIKEGGASEVVMSGLPFATSIDFDADGNAYVSVFGLGEPGSGTILFFEGLTDMEGEPLPEMEMGDDMGDDAEETEEPSDSE